MSDFISDRLSRLPANKALGQHFLFDPSVLRRVARASGPLEGQNVIEVGPGPGGLTAALLEAGCAKVFAIETDARFAEALRQWPESIEERLIVVEADARRVDEAALLAEHGVQGARIISNLPYNVGTPLLIKWLKSGDWRGPMALMFQKEVAERVVARPGQDAYGRLAVITAAVADARIAFTLPPGAFRPPPKVSSAVTVLTSSSDRRESAELAAIERVTEAAFGQRRKMLRSALKGLAGKLGLTPEVLLEEAGIDPSARAETIPPEGFFKLADVWRSRAGH
jgi:16S rRNA (adenine1518-N6/adenine1519-N6)-dimethyltransferase